MEAGAVEGRAEEQAAVAMVAVVAVAAVMAVAAMAAVAAMVMWTPEVATMGNEQAETRTLSLRTARTTGCCCDTNHGRQICPGTSTRPQQHVKHWWWVIWQQLGSEPARVS